MENLQKKTSSAPSGSGSHVAAVATHQQLQNAKKKSNLKDKTRTTRKDHDGPVLEGVDYVSLMMGGRRKAKEEAGKLPRGN